MPDDLTKPLLKFKVFVRAKHRPKTPFFWCSIWRTLPQMREHMKDICDASPGMQNRQAWRSSFGACFIWSIQDNPEMGVIVLAAPYSGASTISHECVHAAFRYCPTVRGRHTADYLEELYACVVGEMSQQIVKRLTMFERKKAKHG